MNEYEQYYSDFDTGYWCEKDADKCRCRGGGWALSELDTWHKCPEHWTKESVHPEDCYPEQEQPTDFVEFEYEEYTPQEPEWNDGELPF